MQMYSLQQKSWPYTVLHTVNPEESYDNLWNISLKGTEIKEKSGMEY